MPQNTPMKRQFTTIDGRTVMSNLPQHWKGDDWAITGVDNPLPVGNYVQTESGVWIPQKGSDDGAADVRVIGSNVEIKRITKSVAANEKEEVGFIEIEGYSKFYVESHHAGLHTKNYEITFRKVTSFGQAVPVEVGEFTVIEPGTFRTRISDVFDVDATRYRIYINNKSDEILNFTISIIGII